MVFSQNFLLDEAVHSVQIETHSQVEVILEQFTSGDTKKSFN